MFEKIIFASCMFSLPCIFAQESTQAKRNISSNYKPQAKEQRREVIAREGAAKSIRRKVLAVRPRPEPADTYEDEEDDYNDEYLEASNSDDVMMPSVGGGASDMTKSSTQNNLPLSTRFILDHGMYLTGSVLYWKNMQSNLGYAISERTPTQSSTDPSGSEVTLIGEIKDLEFDWDYGYRGCIGWRFGANSWDMSLEGTYFRDTANASMQREPSGPVSPYHYIKGLTPDFFDSYISEISSLIKFHYYVLDFILQRPIFQTRSFLARILIGGRGAYIRQDWHTDYYQTGSETSSISPYANIKNDWKYTAAGLKAGLNLQWYWGLGFSLRALAAGASTIGLYEAKAVNSKIDYSQSTTGTKYYYGDVHPKFHRMIPSYQLSVGMQWRGGNRHGGLYFYADWEMNSWRDLHQQYNYAPKFYSDPVSGSISKDSVDMQGLTAGVGIEF